VTTKTLNDIYFEAITRPNRPALQRYKEGGEWRDISAAEFLRRAARLANALESYGVRKGDRVAIFSENRPEWHIADCAILGLGAVDVPLFAQESEERLAFILKDSGARWAIVSRASQLETLLRVWPRLSALEHIITIEPPPHPDPRIHLWSEILATRADETAFQEFIRSDAFRAVTNWGKEQILSGRPQHKVYKH
jgi:long-chain acyl-CoA synthetase